MKPDTILRRISLAIRPVSQRVFRRSGSAKNERQTDGERENCNDHTEGHRGWEMPLPSRVEPGHLEPDENQNEC